MLRLNGHFVLDIKIGRTSNYAIANMDISAKIPHDPGRCKLRTFCCRIHSNCSLQMRDVS